MSSNKTVRLRDLKHGRTIYIETQIGGKLKVISGVVLHRPRKESLSFGHSLYISVRFAERQYSVGLSMNGYGGTATQIFLSDAGVFGTKYDGRPSILFRTRAGAVGSRARKQEFVERLNREQPIDTWYDYDDRRDEPSPEEEEEHKIKYIATSATKLLANNEIVWATEDTGRYNWSGRDVLITMPDGARLFGEKISNQRIRIDAMLLTSAEVVDPKDVKLLGAGRHFAIRHLPNNEHRWMESDTAGPWVRHGKYDSFTHDVEQDEGHWSVTDVCEYLHSNKIRMEVRK